jgi:hypothetical protein
VITRDSVTYVDPPPSAEKTARRVKIVFSDLIEPKVRARKAGIEFPGSLDVMEGYLRRKGFAGIDYTFPPDGGLSGTRPLATLGMRGQEPYPVREARVWGINMMNYLQAPDFFALLRAAGIPLRRRDRNTGHPDRHYAFHSSHRDTAATYEVPDVRRGHRTHLSPQPRLWGTHLSACLTGRLGFTAPGHAEQTVHAVGGLIAPISVYLPR